MYLKSIEIVGFKSFADRTRIELKPGVTGVIGPNGCGKSNVMEAVRWCIGEMSWKSLRSDSMVSIIFAGTARRSPMNLAEVTLVFDNAQSRLPVQYSEVSVSRRIFRSGESEYYLNKTQCRLRDIRELFLDTGIGNDGYAIIDQGGVDFVLKSKPEERRALFEEAAGVAKYKAKREEALRKLDRVEIDLGRLQDSVSLINEQIKKLDADARKAELFRKYKDELRGMEAAHVLGEIGTLRADIRAESERVAPARERWGELKTAVDADSGRLAALNLGRSQQEASVIEANQRTSAHKSEIGRLEERVENGEATTRDLEGQLAASRQEGESERGRMEAMEPDVARTREAHAQAAEVAARAVAEIESFESEVARLKGARDGAAAALEEARRAALSEAEARQEEVRRLSSVDGRRGQLDFQVRNTLRELDKKLRQAEGLAAEAARGEEELGLRGRELEEALARTSALEERQSLGRTALSQLGEETVRLHSLQAGRKAKVEALEIQGSRDPYWLGAQSVVNAGIDGIFGTVRSFIETDEAWRAHVEDLLGERLYAVVCRDAEAARAGVEFLRAAGKGRARFLVAGSLPAQAEGLGELPAEARPVVDGVRCDPAHEKVVRFLLGEAYSLGGALYGRHWVCGGAAEGEARGFKLSDIESLRRELAEGERELADLAGRKASQEAELAALEEELKGARAELQERAARTHRVEAALKSGRESLRLCEEEVGLLEGEAAEALREMALRQQEGLELKAALKERESRETELREAEARAAEGLKAAEEALSARRIEREHLGKSLENLRTQESFLKGQLDRLAADREALERGLKRRAEQEASWEERLKDLARVREESRRRLSELHGELAVLEKEAAALFETLQRLQLDVQSLEASLRERKGEADELQSALHASELKLSELKTREEYLVGRLKAEWELEYEQAAEAYKDHPVDPERIEFLRRRIQALGNVNMAAPEEYEELTKRRDGLQAQVEDLGKAKQDLHEVISKINATTRENFRQTFSEVQQHFRKLYGILFEGGEADVVLTDKDNLLESGIEIVAQPPGKRLQSISQLSGGEKTLTAIALLFAFFMVRPSPVCMLDEADAALDEANVHRFAALLREFGDRTQFLLISHNKATMETCDALYGVTMEESGVSKVLSMDFKKRSGGPQAAQEPRAADADPSGEAAPASA